MFARQSRWMRNNAYKWPASYGIYIHLDMHRLCFLPLVASMWRTQVKSPCWPAPLLLHEQQSQEFKMPHQKRRSFRNVIDKAAKCKHHNRVNCPHIRISDILLTCCKRDSQKPRQQEFTLKSSALVSHNWLPTKCREQCKVLHDNQWYFLCDLQNKSSSACNCHVFILMCDYKVVCTFLDNVDQDNSENIDTEC